MVEIVHDPRPKTPLHGDVMAVSVLESSLVDLIA